MMLSVLGQGLGYSLANLFASKGYKTTGLDIRRETFENPKVDSRMKNYMVRHKSVISKNVRHTTNYEDIIDSDIIFCFVETPLLQNNHLGIESVRRATRSALQVMKRDCIYVMMSTLPVNGSNDLFNEFGNELKKRYVYIPPMIQKVNFLRNYLKPPYLLFGYDREAVDGAMINRLTRFYRTIISNSPPVWHESPLNVEITKLATNAFALMKGTFFNNLASYSGNLGGDPEKVCSMVSSHRVVRKEYTSPGNAIGGPCLPRDVKELYTSGNGKFSELLRKIEDCNIPFVARP